MKLIEALELVIAASSEDDAGHELYEAHRVLTAHIRHLRNKEEGTLPDEPTKVQEYQEYHLTNSKDIGVAFNDRKVWVCRDGQSVFRARVTKGQLQTDYRAVGDSRKWNEDALGSPERDALSVLRQVKQREKRLSRENARLKKKIEELER